MKKTALAFMVMALGAVCGYDVASAQEEPVADAKIIAFFGREDHGLFKTFGAYDIPTKREIFGQLLTTDAPALGDMLKRDRGIAMPRSELEAVVQEARAVASQASLATLRRDELLALEKRPKQLAELSKRISAEQVAGYSDAFDGAKTGVHFQPGVSLGYLSGKDFSGGGFEVNLATVKLGKNIEANLSPGYYSVNGTDDNLLSSKVLASDSRGVVLNNQWQNDYYFGSTYVSYSYIDERGERRYDHEYLGYTDIRLVRAPSQNVTLTNSKTEEESVKTASNLSLITIGNILATTEVGGFMKLFIGPGIAHRDLKISSEKHRQTVQTDQNAVTTNNSELVYLRDYDSPRSGHDVAVADEYRFETITRESVATNRQVLSDEVTPGESRSYSGFVPTLTAGVSGAFSKSVAGVLKVLYVFAPEAESRVTTVSAGIVFNLD